MKHQYPTSNHQFGFANPYNEPSEPSATLKISNDKRALRIGLTPSSDVFVSRIEMGVVDGRLDYGLRVNGARSLASTSRNASLQEDKSKDWTWDIGPAVHYRHKDWEYNASLGYQLRYSQNRVSSLTTTTRDGHGLFADLSGHYAVDLWQDRLQFLTGVGYRFSWINYSKYVLQPGTDGGELTLSRHTVVLDIATLRIRF